jgi:hypothetical protein
MFTVAMKEGLNVDDLILEMIDLGRVEEDYDLDEEEGELTIYG